MTLLVLGYIKQRHAVKNAKPNDSGAVDYFLKGLILCDIRTVLY